MRLSLSLFFATAVASAFTAAQAPEEPAECAIVEAVTDFDVEAYASAPWFVHQLAENSYSPVENNFCVTAEYEIKEHPSFLLGYTVTVNNAAENELGEWFGGELCAYQTEAEDVGKLAVAPCFLPKIFSGDYWVIAYEESDEEAGTDGYALISGGQPTIPAPEGEEGCRTGDGTNQSGLWIFSRNPERSEDLIESVRAIAIEKGFDVSVLNDVDQTSCDYCRDSLETFEDYRGQEKDCAWVRQSWTRLKCLSHKEECPVTCNNCD
jgi:lipocalin